MCEAIQQRSRHPFALKDLLPFAEWQVGRNQGAATFVAVRKDLKQQFRAASTEAKVTQFIADQ